MGEEVASIVICDACGRRAAEILIDKEIALCSECHLKSLRAETRKVKESDKDD